MRLTPSDPDVETIIGRVDTHDIDLQPDFQRGEVWPLNKKQRLIDSILREWHIPPVHLIIDKESQKSSVLDGQQRLAAIRDFKRNLFAIDGRIPPINAEIKRLHGMKYDALPREWKARFNQFTIRVFRITDYDAAEPAELFFRLNQPTALTSAEKRNAFFGSTREQVRHLVEMMESRALGKGFWGFSNARMAYDDIVARTCLTLENGSLRKKITATALADRYRMGTPFNDQVISSLQRAIEACGLAKARLTTQLNLNKATAQTCLIFCYQLSNQIEDIQRVADCLGGFLTKFSVLEMFSTLAAGVSAEALMGSLPPATGEALIRAYHDRSTSRVADTSSVVLRDFVIWCAFRGFARGQSDLSNLAEIRKVLSLETQMQSLHSPEQVEVFVNSTAWDLIK